MAHQKFRNEKDSMGTVKVPDTAYYGANTQRAYENFQFSSLNFPSSFIHTIALIKKSAASANTKFGLLDNEISQAICKASEEILDEKYEDQFIVDVFQTGSGTSTNMNINEVIATRANEILTGKKSSHTPVHPNDHVNLGQSSNDVIPTAIHISAIYAMKMQLIPSLCRLYDSFARKSTEFSTIKKMGRTHLQDAVPITLGEEFSGYARQISLGMERIKDTFKRMEELALGGTAVGTGINTHKDFARTVIKLLSDHFDIRFKEANNHFEAQGAQDAALDASGALKTVAVSLLKIANDIRFLSSGPRCGLGELTIPSLQPGSSIMPGKVNPVIPEAVIQIAAQVIGNDTTITIGGQMGNFELNTMLPVMAYNLLQSIDLMSSAAELFAKKCIDDIKANPEKCKENIGKSLAMVTYLVPHIGYDKAALIAEAAYKTGKTIKEILEEKKIVTGDVTHLLEAISTYY